MNDFINFPLLLSYNPSFDWIVSCLLSTSTNSFKDAASRAVQRMGTYKGTVTDSDIIGKKFKGDLSVIISCGDIKFLLRPISVGADGRRRFEESRLGYVAPEPNPNQGICGGKTQAMTISNIDQQQTNNIPKWHIILCDHADNVGAMRLPNKRIGDSWNRRNWYNVPYDDFAKEYTSHVSAHELAHVAGDCVVDKGA